MWQSFRRLQKESAHAGRCGQKLSWRSRVKADGRFASVDEAFILSGRDALARLGFYVEPTSALVWRALEESISSLPDPVVVVLTGSGLNIFHRGVN